MPKIKCPFCGCTPEQGFDCIGSADKGDDDVRGVYNCQRCHKDSVRVYKFVAWENPDGTRIRPKFIPRDYEQYPEELCGDMGGDCMNCPLPMNMRKDCLSGENL